MSHYEYPDDGKIHLSYSELKRCTEKGVYGLMAERNGFVPPFSNGATTMGEERHQVFADFLKSKKMLPIGFQEASPICANLVIDPNRVERHLAVEMYQGVVLHGHPDLFGDIWVAEYKVTSRDIKVYLGENQIDFYAWLLSYYGLKIQYGLYLCEIWDKEKTGIIEYQIGARMLNADKIAKVEEWAIGRISNVKKYLLENDY